MGASVLLFHNFHLFSRTVTYPLFLLFPLRNPGCRGPFCFHFWHLISPWETQYSEDHLLKSRVWPFKWSVLWLLLSVLLRSESSWDREGLGALPLGSPQPSSVLSVCRQFLCIHLHLQGRERRDLRVCSNFRKSTGSERSREAWFIPCPGEGRHPWFYIHEIPLLASAYLFSEIVSSKQGKKYCPLGSQHLFSDEI